MKIKDLIKLLEGFPPDYELVVIAWISHKMQGARKKLPMEIRKIELKDDMEFPAQPREQ